MKVNVYLIISIALILFGCNNSREVAMKKVEEQFKRSLEEVTSSKSIDSEIYMVIPRAGCNGCISTAEAYMLESLADSSQYFLQFILTDFDSEKLLRAKFGDNFKDERVILDPNNVFRSNESLKSIYPIIYFFDDDFRLTNVGTVSPTENGIAELALYVNNRKLINGND